MAVTVEGDAILATSATTRSMPCAFSTSEISTVTPQTMTITRHGIRLTASPSSAAPLRTRMTAPRNAPMPTWTSKAMAPTISAEMTAIVIQWRHSNGPSPASAASMAPDAQASADDVARDTPNSFRPPNIA